MSTMIARPAGDDYVDDWITEPTGGVAIHQAIDDGLSGGSHTIVAPINRGPLEIVSLGVILEEIPADFTALTVKIRARRQTSATCEWQLVTLFDDGLDGQWSGGGGGGEIELDTIWTTHEMPLVETIVGVGSTWSAPKLGLFFQDTSNTIDSVVELAAVEVWVTYPGSSIARRAAILTRFVCQP